MVEPIAQGVKRYIQQSMFSIPGFMHPVDGACYAALLLYQREHNLSGSVAEIGVFFGRSFFLMAKTLGPQEKAFAVDLFESGPKIEGRSRQLREFHRTAEMLDLKIDPDCLFSGPSDRLKPSDILESVGRVRFFSIDGGHMVEHLQADAALASAVIAHHGILAFDDFCNPEWPEVSLGVFDFLRSRPNEYAPFAITKAKLYICRQAFHKLYLAAVSESSWMQGFPQKEITLLGSPLVWFHHPTFDRILFHGLVKAGLGSIAFAIQSQPRSRGRTTVLRYRIAQSS